MEISEDGLITEPSEATDIRYHTLFIESVDGGGFRVSARNNETITSFEVGSVTMAGTSVGFASGEAKFDAGGSWIKLDYVDFTEAYGYEEVRVTFEER